MRLSLLVPFFQHRVLLAAALALSGCGLALAQSAADNWPTKPVRLVVAFPAGGLADVLARMLAPQLSEALGQQVVIDNRGGGEWQPGGRRDGSQRRRWPHLHGQRVDHRVGQPLDD